MEEDDRKTDLRRRARRLAEELSAMVDEGHPLAAFAILYYETTLGRFRRTVATRVPPPFGDSPLVDVVEAMLPSVRTRDPDSAQMIGVMLDRVRQTADPLEKRTLGHALEWFYLYFTGQTDTEFETWLANREKKPEH